MKKADREKRNAAIIVYRKAHWTYAMIANKLNTTEGVVYNVCKSYGLGGKMATGAGKGEKRICLRCGKEFECAPGHNKKFCGLQCERASSHERNDVRRRIRGKYAKIDIGITLKAIYKRDNGVCHICGEKTDWNSYKIINNKKCSYGNYPTRDHVVPLALGGTDTWDNVKLACFKCNARKGARLCG